MPNSVPNRHKEKISPEAFARPSIAELFGVVFVPVFAGFIFLDSRLKSDLSLQYAGRLLQLCSILAENGGSSNNSGAQGGCERCPMNPNDYLD